MRRRGPGGSSIDTWTGLAEQLGGLILLPGNQAAGGGEFDAGDGNAWEERFAEF